MKDPIERQDAIEALEREQSHDKRPITEIRWFGLGLRKAQEILRALPSANTLRISEQSAWHHIGETLVAESKSEITAEDAVKKIREYLRLMEKFDRPKSSWRIWTTLGFGDTFCCDHCGGTFTILQGEDMMRFCPKCGADML